MSNQVGMIEMGGGSQAPFILWNITQNAANMINTGTAAPMFQLGAPWHSDWGPNPDEPAIPPLPTHTRDLGGDACTPLTCVFALNNVDGVGVGAEIHLLGENWDGWLLFVECYQFGGDSVYVYIDWYNSAFPNLATLGYIAYAEFSGVDFTDGVTAIVTFDPANAIGGSRFWLNGNTSPGFVNNRFYGSGAGAGCAAITTGGQPGSRYHGEVEDPAPYGQMYMYHGTNFGGGGRGLAYIRGPVSEADYQYWGSYDWATHPGFA